MHIPQKYLEIASKFTGAAKDEDFTEVEKIPLEDLKSATKYLVADKNAIYYQFILEMIKKKESIDGGGAVIKNSETYTLFVAREDRDRIKNERLRALIDELNISVGNGCPHGSAALMRAIIVSSITLYGDKYHTSAGLPKDAGRVMEEFARLSELPKTVREAAVHLRSNIKILGDLAMHSKDVIVTMSDINNCAAIFKTVVQWIATNSGE